MLSLARSIERNSEHIIAQAIVRYAEAQGAETFETTDFTAYPGIGASATVVGKKVMVGGPQLLQREQLSLPPSFVQYEQSSATKVWVVLEREVVGVFLLDDTIRETSKEAIHALRELGIETWMLTGDNEAVAAAVAEQSGIDHFRAGLMPDEKLDAIKAIRRDGEIVAMVGDGVNDAPALLTADIGIAIGAGTDIAIESADIVLTQNDLQSVVHAVTLSRRTYRKMEQNLWWAGGYNIVAIPLAAGVLARWGILVDPAIGAVLMSASTVIVALNAQLLKKSAV